MEFRVIVNIEGKLIVAKTCIVYNQDTITGASIAHYTGTFEEGGEVTAEVIEDHNKAITFIRTITTFRQRIGMLNDGVCIWHILSPEETIHADFRYIPGTILYVREIYDVLKKEHPRLIPYNNNKYVRVRLDRCGVDSYKIIANADFTFELVLTRDEFDKKFKVKS